MSGRPSIPAKIHARIRKLAAGGETRKAIARIVGCSRYTVMAALDPEWRAREAERHRRDYPARHAERLEHEGYVEYRAAYFASDGYRAAVRTRMAAARAAKAAPKPPRKRAAKASLSTT